MKFLNHMRGVTDALKDLETENIEQLLKSLVRAVEDGGTLFLAGNGGSFAIAQHIATDWSKGLFISTGKKLPCIVLNGNPSTETATANDLGYENSIALPLEIMAKAKDLVLLISSSGNSANIIKAAEKGRELGCSVFGFSGFGKSKLFESVDSCLTIDNYDYQIIEDVHAVLGHAILKELIELCS